MKRICKFFGIHRLGWLEFIIALYPILAAYTYGALRCDLLVPLILDVVLFLSPKRRCNIYNMRPLYWLIGFLFIHFLLWIFVITSPPTHYYNYNIMIFVVMLSLLFIIPYIDFFKLCSAINLMGLLAACGLIYHSIELTMGHNVSPISLPFMPTPDITSRIHEITDRPVSFFAEPQSYVSYMIVPLFLSLQRKNLLYALLLSITILLSTSTTGIAMLVILFGAYFMMSKGGGLYRVLLIIGLVGLGYFLLTSEYTLAGREKMNNTNIEENARVANGFLVAETMSYAEKGLGVPYANVKDYCYATRVTNRVIMAGDGSIFISAFWIAFIQYGIIGLLLYLNVYYQIIKKDRSIFPYWLCIVVALFTNPDFIGANFAFILFFSYPYVYVANLQRNENNMYAYNSIRK